MTNLEALTTSQTAWIMLVEAKNELTKCKLMDRLHQRMLLKGEHKQVLEKMMAKNQTAMPYIEATIKDLEDIYKDELAKEKDSAIIKP